ncbi:nitrate reductase associated protein [Persicitalea jodogahamensis]|uniref:Uncharacterized protein n=1 Tax=Persicitalea jodogahamensis TaxID=402147 RepID=A0A8J3G7R2_9BACT|nr:nitrate reductase associated protein [Persicitalea jodogahamensis]GHB59025.1 hypothetical protein GCM10007390_10840 [Persicitalea jodogahamensis]
MHTILVKPVYFDFENDFVDTLRCIPMIVRYKLDTANKKLQLAEWSRLTSDEKQTLAELPCESPAEVEAYRKYLDARVWERSKKAVKDLGGVDATWENLGKVPLEVIAKAHEWHCTPPTLSQWMGLGLLQRFALVKLSRSGHEGENFPKALVEFGIG